MCQITIHIWISIIYQLKDKIGGGEYFFFFEKAIDTPLSFELVSGTLFSYYPFLIPIGGLPVCCVTLQQHPLQPCFLIPSVWQQFLCLLFVCFCVLFCWQHPSRLSEASTRCFVHPSVRAGSDPGFLEEFLILCSVLG